MAQPQGLDMGFAARPGDVEPRSFGGAYKKRRGDLRTFGERLGRGETTEQIFGSTRQVAEGAKSSASLLALAERTGVYAPIAQHVAAVVAGKMTAPQMMESFISRDTKDEAD